MNMDDDEKDNEQQRRKSSRTTAGKDTRKKYADDTELQQPLKEIVKQSNAIPA